MELIIVSGLSGAGKSHASNVLEDLGYYCIDNLPVDLIPDLAAHCLATTGRYDRVALVTDVRGSLTFEGLFQALQKLDVLGLRYSIMYFEASTDTLLKRYKETRRRHPLQKNSELTLTEAIEREKQLMEPVRNRAAYIFDTTSFTLSRLHKELSRILSSSEREKSMAVEVVSFGFKKGILEEADLVFDVRFLPNPYYIEALRSMNGTDKEVSDFVFSYQQTKDFVEKLKDMLAFSLPLYMEEGKANLIIGIGCTGGKHRSVAVAENIAEYIQSKGFVTEVRHRDMQRS